METSEELAAVILDSSVWIAYLHKEDSQHTKARTLVGTLPNPLLVPAEVLSEVATALKNKKQVELAKGFVLQVLSGNSPLRVSDEGSVRATAETFVSRRDKLSFTDTALLILSDRYRVITFDKQLEKAIIARN